ncbi:hypothetical protein B0T26DRAFT_530617 [Lasiosphaeria miniovina]|uniref:Secreted protein n=1 Tax=Lasiosphaeria miniovina TaxID=1954250 RepID=A0AA40DFR6_9PEZI|nr:uncharacterized protein B0T26DRAFT_530617 [Lasiosphaeria miniovina]KAK0701794.1 hypothetical protein B0T26DRAFT_530617 [Lasiosphaeria miniovina]
MLLMLSSSLFLFLCAILPLLACLSVGVICHQHPPVPAEWELLLACCVRGTRVPKSHYQNVNFGAWTNELCKGWYYMLEVVKKYDQEENTGLIFASFYGYVIFRFQSALSLNRFLSYSCLKWQQLVSFSSQMSGLT